MDQLEEKAKILVGDIAKKDRRFRISQAIFITLSSFSLMALLIFSYEQQLSNHKLLDTLTNNSKQRTAQIADLQKHLDCVLLLFGQKNRATLSITNVSNCQISESNSKAQVNSIAPEASTNRQQGSNVPTINNAPQPVNTAITTPSKSQPNSPTPPEPVKLLGLSVCVPFTHLCVME